VPDLGPAGRGQLRARRAAARHAAEMDAFSRRVEEGPPPEPRRVLRGGVPAPSPPPGPRRRSTLTKESATTRERYGSGRLGAGCLLARRLIEAGARFVTVVDTGWDMHQQIFRELPDSRFPGSGKLPQLDRAYFALIDDLRERGLLSTTLVALLGEFGRTPKINALAGRDHWPRAGFACPAGAASRAAGWWGRPTPGARRPPTPVTLGGPGVHRPRSPGDRSGRELVTPPGARADPERGARSRRSCEGLSFPCGAHHPGSRALGPRRSARWPSPPMERLWRSRRTDALSLRSPRDDAPVRRLAVGLARIAALAFHPSAPLLAAMGGEPGRRAARWRSSIS
jgi:hypothetical protein